MISLFLPIAYQEGMKEGMEKGFAEGFKKR